MIVGQLGVYLLIGLLALIAYLGFYHGIAGRPADKTGPPVSLPTRAAVVALGLAAILGLIGLVRLAFGPPLD
jgi:hypothetical protein